MKISRDQFSIHYRGIDTKSVYRHGLSSPLPSSSTWIIACLYTLNCNRLSRHQSIWFFFLFVSAPAPIHSIFKHRQSQNNNGKRDYDRRHRSITAHATATHDLLCIRSGSRAPLDERQSQVACHSISKCTCLRCSSTHASPIHTLAAKTAKRRCPHTHAHSQQVTGQTF